MSDQSAEGQCSISSHPQRPSANGFIQVFAIIVLALGMVVGTYFANQSQDIRGRAFLQQDDEKIPKITPKPTLKKTPSTGVSPGKATSGLPGTTGKIQTDTSTGQTSSRPTSNQEGKAAPSSSATGGQSVSQSQGQSSGQDQDGSSKKKKKTATKGTPTPETTPIPKKVVSIDTFEGTGQFPKQTSDTTKATDKEDSSLTSQVDQISQPENLTQVITQAPKPQATVPPPTEAPTPNPDQEPQIVKLPEQIKPYCNKRCLSGTKCIPDLKGGKCVNDFSQPSQQASQPQETPRPDTSQRREQAVQPESPFLKTPRSFGDLARPEEEGTGAICSTGPLVSVLCPSGLVCRGGICSLPSDQVALRTPGHPLFCAVNKTHSSCPSAASSTTGSPLPYTFTQEEKQEVIGYYNQISNYELELAGLQVEGCVTQVCINRIQFLDKRLSELENLNRNCQSSTSVCEARNAIVRDIDRRVDQALLPIQQAREQLRNSAISSTNQGNEVAGCISRELCYIADRDNPYGRLVTADEIVASRNLSQAQRDALLGGSIVVTRPWSESVARITDPTNPDTREVYVCLDNRSNCRWIGRPGTSSYESSLREVARDVLTREDNLGVLASLFNGRDGIYEAQDILARGENFTIPEDIINYYIQRTYSNTTSLLTILDQDSSLTYDQREALASWMTEDIIHSIYPDVESIPQIQENILARDYPLRFRAEALNRFLSAGTTEERAAAYALAILPGLGPTAVDLGEARAAFQAGDMQTGATEGVNFLLGYASNVLEATSYSALGFGATQAVGGAGLRALPGYLGREALQEFGGQVGAEVGGALCRGISPLVGIGCSVFGGIVGGGGAGRATRELSSGSNIPPIAFQTAAIEPYRPVVPVMITNPFARVRLNRIYFEGMEFLSMHDPFFAAALDNMRSRIPRNFDGLSDFQKVEAIRQAVREYNLDDATTFRFLSYRSTDYSQILERSNNLFDDALESQTVYPVGKHFNPECPAHVCRHNALAIQVLAAENGIEVDYLSFRFDKRDPNRPSGWEASSHAVAIYNDTVFDAYHRSPYPSEQYFEAYRGTYDELYSHFVSPFN